jgi:hypothetical protein
VSEVLVFPAGSTIMFTSGEYSDFRMCGCFVTLKECDLKALMREFMLTAPIEKWSRTPEPNNFGSWLCAQGHAFTADIQTVHVGDYSVPDTELLSSTEYDEVLEARKTDAEEAND